MTDRILPAVVALTATISSSSLGRDVTLVAVGGIPILVGAHELRHRFVGVDAA